MRKVVGYKCQVCGKLSEGHILDASCSIGAIVYVIKFEMECCGAVHQKYFDKSDMKHYVKEVDDESQA